MVVAASATIVVAEVAAEVAAEVSGDGGGGGWEWLCRVWRCAGWWPGWGWAVGRRRSDGGGYGGATVQTNAHARGRCTPLRPGTHCGAGRESTAAPPWRRQAG